MIYPYEQDAESAQPAGDEQREPAQAQPVRYGPSQPGEASAAGAGPDDTDVPDDTDDSDDTDVDEDVIVVVEVADASLDRPAVADSPAVATADATAAAARAPVSADPVRDDDGMLATAAAGSPALAGPGQLSGQEFAQEWREIQASFVDDPRGAVQLAAETADAALTALVTSLRERQAALGPTVTQDTEQMRIALQQYRKICQAVAEVGRRLSVPEPAAGAGVS